MKLTQSEFMDITHEVMKETLDRAKSEGLKPESSMILTMTYAAAFSELADKLFNNETEIEFTED